jgi:hypothetical protein
MISESAAQAEDRRAIRRKLLANKRNIPTHYGGNLNYQAMFASVASTDSHSPTNQKFNNESHGSTPVLASLDENNASVEVSSKELEKARKLAARKVRNRLSAEASRKRVRDEIESLTAKCGKYTLRLDSSPSLAPAPSPCLLPLRIRIQRCLHKASC